MSTIHLFLEGDFWIDANNTNDMHHMPESWVCIADIRKCAVTFHPSERDARAALAKDQQPEA